MSAHPLSEDLVLIHGDESSKSEGVDLVNHDAVGGSVASELLVRSYPLNLSLTFPCLLQLRDDLRLKAKLRQTFRSGCLNVSCQVKN